MNGTIPSWLYDIPALMALSLENNQLTGHIGEFLHNSLVVLQLSHNKLHGPLPISIAKLVRLLLLEISFNNVSGHLESSMFSKLKNLRTIDLSHNPLLSFHMYSYNIADYTLPKLQYLYLSSCNPQKIHRKFKFIRPFQQPNHWQYSDVVVGGEDGFIELPESFIQLLGKNRTPSMEELECS